MMLLIFIHIVTYISSFFIFITDYYSVMGIIYLLIHQLVDIWIVSSLGNIMKEAHNKDMCKVFMWTCVFISLECLGVGLLSHMVSICLTL